jgi:hypothetical protein
MLEFGQEGNLTWLWTRASAGLPLGLLLVGVMHREVSSRWSTTAELPSRWSTDDDWVA